MDKFADRQDYEVCRRIQRQYGSTYYFATLRFPRHIQRRVWAVYGFVRVPDEWVDNPGSLSVQKRLDLLAEWRDQLHRGMAGERPEHPAMRAFVDTVREAEIPVSEAELFLDAMEMDVYKSRYATYDELQAYMRGSAAAVGVMMCYAMDARPDDETLARARALGDAMQMTNFLRDVAEDVDRGRIYIPLEDMREHGVLEGDILAKRFTPQFRELMRYEVCRAKKLYFYSDHGLPRLHRRMRRAVMVARLSYAQILEKIEAQGYDVFQGRARTSKAAKIRCALRVVVAEDHLLHDMVKAPC